MTPTIAGFILCAVAGLMIGLRAEDFGDFLWNITAVVLAQTGVQMV